ncbi:hypothetical protein [Paraflavitalea speifideaquila]|uniref:hypothetical protein n=1 Tax=Paraflavitalea speifideaquila TaxID=3076558 RepID=UPI0028E7B323|nr:hypothetical protein [Paraflavitalea speifideiaquila]
MTQDLVNTPPSELFSIKGIGDSVGKKILEIVQNDGRLKVLEEYIEKTPQAL